MSQLQKCNKFMLQLLKCNKFMSQLIERKKFMSQLLERNKFMFQLHCTPEPDAFNPCEDLIGNWVLRMGVWIVCTLAVLGNLTLFTVTLLSTNSTKK